MAIRGRSPIITGEAAKKLTELMNITPEECAKTKTLLDSAREQNKNVRIIHKNADGTTVCPTCHR